MADTTNKKDGSARLKRNVSKMAFRSREKMLRTFGMGEETKDEIIDNYVHLVSKQQAQFHKFQRDMRFYLQSIIAMKTAADNFYSSLGEIYEDDWVGKDMISSLAKTTDLLYHDLHARLNTEVISALQDHLTQCSDMKVKVSKRGRKLVDFDASRRTLQALQTSKKLEESKLAKARDHVTQTHETYETFNSQLHHELPDLYDSRVVLTTDIIKSIASAEKSFFIELSEIREKLSHVVANVRDAYDNGEYQIQRLHSPVVRSGNLNDNAERSTLPADDVIGTRSRGHSEAVSENSDKDRTHSDSSHHHSSSHSHDRRDRPVEPHRHRSQHSQKKKESNDYVNIDVGRRPVVEEEPLDDDAPVQDDHVTNGHDQSEPDNIYTPPEYDESNVENEAAQVLATSIPQDPPENPKPSPRIRTHESLSDENHGAPVGDPPQVVVSPSPKPRTVVPPEIPKRDDIDDHLPAYNGENGGSEKVETAPRPSTSEPDYSESQNKRKSLRGTSGLQKLMSTFSRSPKPKTEAEIEDSQKKRKSGLFALTKKNKKKEETLKKDSTKERNETEPKIQPGNPPLPRPNIRDVFQTTDTKQQHGEDGNVSPSSLEVKVNRESPSGNFPSAENQQLTVDNDDASTNVHAPCEIEYMSDHSQIQHEDVDEEHPVFSRETHDQTLISSDETEDNVALANNSAFEESYNGRVSSKPESLSDDAASYTVEESHPLFEKIERDTEEMPTFARFDDLPTDASFREQGLKNANEPEKEDGMFSNLPDSDNKASVDKLSLALSIGNDDVNIPDDSSVSLSDEVNSHTSDIELNSIGSMHSLDEVDKHQEVEGMPHDHDLVQVSKGVGESSEVQMQISDNNEGILTYQHELNTDHFETAEKLTKGGLSYDDATLHDVANDECLYDVAMEAPLEALVRSTAHSTHSEDTEDQRRELQPAEEDLFPSNVQGKNLSDDNQQTELDVDGANGIAFEKMEQPALSEKEVSAETDEDDEGLYETMDRQHTEATDHVIVQSTHHGRNGDIDIGGRYVDMHVNGPTNSKIPSHSDSGEDDIYERFDDYENSKQNGVQPIYDVPPASSGENTPGSRLSVDDAHAADKKDSAETHSEEILPPHFLYKAQAMFPYNGTDEDELAFVKGDVIYVVEFPDPDEQDDGWQMGILRSSWEDTGSTSGMAVFPENFTKRM